jgi:hypothetical protein
MSTSPKIAPEEQVTAASTAAMVPPETPIVPSVPADATPPLTGEFEQATPLQDSHFDALPAHASTEDPASAAKVANAIAPLGAYRGNAFLVGSTPAEAARAVLSPAAVSRDASDLWIMRARLALRQDMTAAFVREGGLISILREYVQRHGQSEPAPPARGSRPVQQRRDTAAVGANSNSANATPTGAPTGGIVECVVERAIAQVVDTEATVSEVLAGARRRGDLHDRAPNDATDRPGPAALRSPAHVAYRWARRYGLAVMMPVKATARAGRPPGAQGNDNSAHAASDLASAGENTVGTAGTGTTTGTRSTIGVGSMEVNLSGFTGVSSNASGHQEISHFRIAIYRPNTAERELALGAALRVLALLSDSEALSDGNTPFCPIPSTNLRYNGRQYANLRALVTGNFVPRNGASSSSNKGTANVSDDKDKHPHQKSQEATPAAGGSDKSLSGDHEVAKTGAAAAGLADSVDSPGGVDAAQQSRDEIISNDDHAGQPMTPSGSESDVEDTGGDRDELPGAEDRGAEADASTPAINGNTGLSASKKERPAVVLTDGPTRRAAFFTAAHAAVHASPSFKLALLATGLAPLVLPPTELAVAASSDSQPVPTASTSFAAPASMVEYEREWLVAVQLLRAHILRSDFGAALSGSYLMLPSDGTSLAALAVRYRPTSTRFVCTTKDRRANINHAITAVINEPNKAINWTRLLSAAAVNPAASIPRIIRAHLPELISDLLFHRSKRRPDEEHDRSLVTVALAIAEETHALDAEVATLLTQHFITSNHAYAAFLRTRQVRRVYAPDSRSSRGGMGTSGGPNGEPQQNPVAPREAWAVLSHLRFVPHSSYMQRAAHAALFGVTRGEAEQASVGPRPITIRPCRPSKDLLVIGGAAAALRCFASNTRAKAYLHALATPSNIATVVRFINLASDSSRIGSYATAARVALESLSGLLDRLVAAAIAVGKLAHEHGEQEQQQQHGQGSKSRRR